MSETVAPVPSGSTAPKVKTVPNNDKAFKLLGYSGSKEDIKKGKEIKKKVAKQDEKDHKKSLEISKDKLLYEDRLQRSQLALVRIQDSQPASDQLVMDFEAAHRKAIAKAELGDYKGANKELHEVHVSKAPGQAIELWNKMVNRLGTSAPKVKELVDQIEQALTAQKVLPAQAAINFRTSRRELARPAIQKSPTKEDITGAEQDLQRLLDSLNFAIEEATTGRDDVRPRAIRVTRLLNELAPEGPTDLPLLSIAEGAEFRNRKRGADALITLADYANAKIALDGLASELRDIRARLVPARDAWVDVAGGLAAQVEAVAAFKLEATAPLVLSELETLASGLAEITTLGPGKGMPYPEAVDRLGAAPARLLELRQMQSDWASLNQAPKNEDGTPRQGGKSPLEAAKGRIARLVADVDTSFAALHTTVLDANDNTGAELLDGPFLARLGSITGTWAENLKTATTPEGLDENGIAALLVALARDIDALAGDGGALATALGKANGDKRSADARGAYDLARATAMTQIDKLLAMNAEPGALLVRSVEIIDGELAQMTTPEEVGLATTRVTAQGAEALRQIAALQDTVNNAQTRIKDLLDPVESKLATLFKEVEKARSGAKQTPLAALHETLLTSYDTLRAVQKSSQIAVLIEALVEAEQLAHEIDVSLAAATGSGVEESGAMTFDEARKQIVELKGKLSENRVQMYCIETATTLTEELTTLEKGLGGSTMSALTKKLTDLTQQVVAVKLKATKAKADCAKFETTIDLVREELKKPDFKDAPDYVKAMEGRLSGILTNARFEGGLDGATVQLAALSKELEDILAGPKSPLGVPLALEGANGKAVDDRRKGEMDKARFEGEAEVLEKAIAALRSGPVATREIDGLESSLDLTVKAAKKGGDYDGGRSQLFAIRKRMSLLTANPGGLNITARNNLPGVMSRLKQAIIAYTLALDTVQKAVNELPDTDLDQVGKKLVADELIVARGLFNWTLLERPVAAILSPGSDDKARSGAREQALRPLRAMIASMQNEFRLQMLAKTPFNPAMPSVLSAVNLSLLDLENNLLVSL